MSPDSRRPLPRVALATALVLVAAESTGYLWLRLTGNRPNVDVTATHVHRYNTYRVFELNPSHALHSPDGFRSSRAVAVQKPAGVYRIFLMGGSTVYGMGSGSPFAQKPPLTNSQTIDRFIEERLNAELTRRGIAGRAEVINAGLTNYNTYLEFVYVLERLHRYEPDLLVHLDGTNDFFNLLEGYDHLADLWFSYKEVADLLNQRDLTFGLFALSRALSDHSYLFRALSYALEARINRISSDHFVARSRAAIPLSRIEQAYPGYARDSFLRCYRMIGTLGAQYGFQISVFLQPYVTFERDENLSLEDLETKRTTVKLLRDRNWAPEARERARPLLPALFAESRIPFTDLGDIGSPSTRRIDLYYDYCHLTPNGSRVVGFRIAQEILEGVVRSFAVRGEPGAPRGSQAR